MFMLPFMVNKGVYNMSTTGRSSGVWGGLDTSLYVSIFNAS